jgi:hypothetical protein
MLKKKIFYLKKVEIRMFYFYLYRLLGDILFEGTSGSTGVSLTMACKNKGYASHIYLPDDQAIEKVAKRRQLLKTY